MAPRMGRCDDISGQFNIDAVQCINIKQWSFNYQTMYVYKFTQTKEPKTEHFIISVEQSKTKLRLSF